MTKTHNVRLRMMPACMLVALGWLAWVPRIGADPKPLTKEEQAKIDQTIDKGVAFLKKVQTKEGDFGWKMYPSGYFVGQCALPAYALLESGVPADDLVIQKAAAFLRPRSLLNDRTYELALALLFFDRLGDPKDKQLIRTMALRLLAGQHQTGGWSYRCPILSERDEDDLVKTLEELSKHMRSRDKERNRSLDELEIPHNLQALTVFQRKGNLLWQEPSFSAAAQAEAFARVSLTGRTDNSNTQFAILGLWAAQRHGIALDPTFEIMVERFERFQVYPSGIWKYDMEREFSGASRPSMICVGLIGLAVGRGLNLKTPGAAADPQKDIHVLRGLAALSNYVGKPTGRMGHRLAIQDHYFLWSLERVGMLYNLQTIGDRDWYRWGAEILVSNQAKQGWWRGPATPEEVKSETRMRDYGATLNTAFALLFLKRSHPMKELTPRLPFTEKNLNQGIARLKSGGKFLGPKTITSRESRSLESQDKRSDP